MLTFLKKFWRETLILLLITTMSFGYAFYTNKLADSQTQIQNALFDLSVAKMNADTLEGNLDQLIVDIEELEGKNRVLEDDWTLAKLEIDKLQARPPEVIVRTVYEQTLPEQCLGKFDWMLAEAIRMSGDK